MRETVSRQEEPTQPSEAIVFLHAKASTKNRVVGTGRPAVVAQLHRREAQPVVRVLGEELKLGGELVRMPPIVGVLDGDERAARVPDRPVSRVPSAIALVATHRDARIGDRLQALARIIGRTIVDDDDFEIADRLVEHALNSFLDERRVVIRGENDRDERRVAHVYHPNRDLCLGATAALLRTSDHSALRPGSGAHVQSHMLEQRAEAVCLCFRWPGIFQDDLELVGHRQLGAVHL